MGAQASKGAGVAATTVEAALEDLGERVEGDVELQAAIATRPTRGIVIGLPLNMDGSESPRSQSSRAFARNIEDLGLPVLLRDERWSTQAVERDMIAADMSRAKRAEKIDSGAAAFILQGAIDRLAGGVL